MATPRRPKDVVRVAREPKTRPPRKMTAGSAARAQMMASIGAPVETIYKVGRPTLYKPEFCDKVIQMGSEGCSVMEMAGYFGVARNTLEKLWPEAHPEFMQAFQTARVLSQNWWEGLGRHGTVTKDIDSGLWAKNVAGRFPKDWTELRKVEASGPDGGPIVVEDRAKSLMDRIMANAGRLGSKPTASE